ncbi:TetR/AcrR family transcriptional regulator [Sporichthya sp.]|uniref:TetR/AcrR family transcriptional regulator n=1 Tax=Sporichthya sp. TaxID=65475 RepID=UPI0017A98F7D|nr:TetR family transcriptional regulator [Sporichthya sp.]MBA3744131.1 TetR family transcriptional regulator [Sporichthya sp.]
MTSPEPLSGQAARWAGQRERRQAEFVDSALKVIAEQGPAASLEDFAAEAGVARTRVYRHFTDRADLEHAISGRVAAMIVAELEPLWHPEGSARQMIRAAIGAHVTWLAENRNLYAYLRRHARPEDDATDLDGYGGVRRAVAEHLAGLFGTYLSLVGVTSETSATLAHAVVGMVESVSEHWAQQGAEAAAADLVIAQLSDWTWALMATALAAVGVELDPDLPLPPLV